MNPNRALFLSHALRLLVSLLPGLLVCLLVCLLIGSVPLLATAQTAAAPAAPAIVAPAAAASAPATVASLDSRVQALKAEALRLSRDLQLLEEELLFPPGTQVAVFVSLEGAADTGTGFDLESLQIKLGDKVVAQVLYTAPELQALRRGAVQRLFVGNLRTGSHSFEATATGREGPGRAAYKRSASISFEKGTAPRYIELRIKEAAKKDASDKPQPEFEVKVWQ
jgi:hypothetical protein